MRGPMIETVDYHTAGEPFRIVVSAIPGLDTAPIAEGRPERVVTGIPGATVRARRDAVPEEADTVRRLDRIAPG